MNDLYITIETSLNSQRPEPWEKIPPTQYKSSWVFLWGKIHLLIYFEDVQKQKKHTSESLKKLAEIIEKGSLVILYAQSPDAFVKIEITQDRLNVYPLEPYCMKQGIDASKPSLDLAVYIKIALNLCGELFIFSLETKQLEN